MSNSTTVAEQKRITIIKPDPKQARNPRHRYKGPRPLTMLLSLLAFIALVHLLLVAHAGDPGVVPSNCMSLIRSTDYTQVIHLQAQAQQMQAVQFINQITGGEPSALVQVTNTGPQQTLDVYVYGCTMQKQGPKLNVLFSQRGLVQGTVTVSPANALIISELDSLLSPQTTILLQPQQQNVYREYAWHNGSFGQILFPSLYPVTSRSEAEALQQQANNGQTLPWTNPLVTAEQMSKDVLKWPTSDPQDSVLSNDGTTAQVELFQRSSHLHVRVTLKRLIETDSKGLWFVTGAATSGVTLDPEQFSNPAPSPLTFSGTGALTDGQTTATLFDHTLTPLVSVNNVPLYVNSDGTYTGTLSYTNITPGEQGVLLVQSLPGNNGNSTNSEMGQLLLMGVILG